MIDKAVVGSGCGDAPKCAGEGVALHGTPGALGVLLPQCQHPPSKMIASWSFPPRPPSSLPG